MLGGKRNFLSKADVMASRRKLKLTESKEFLTDCLPPAVTSRETEEGVGAEKWGACWRGSGTPKMVTEVCV